jgi:polyhydroxyalkanoate synthesis regulator phasin
MTPDTLSETLQKGFHVTLGATAALLEAVQNPQASSQRFAELGNDVNRITEELEAKGEVTEREARQLVDSLLSQVPNPFQTSGSASMPTVDTVATPVADSGVQNDLAALTQELAEIRREIEALKEKSA